MAQYKLSREFTQLKETAGVLYAMPECSVEIATGTDEPQKDTGFILHGGCPFPFSADAIWARAAGSHAVLNVVPGKLPM